LPTFVFFHVGDDVSAPKLLVKSIRKSNPGSTVIMCTDHNTPKISDVDKTLVAGCDTSKLMTSRVNAFKELSLQTPAVYLDTDILVTGRIPQLETMTASSVMLCRRSFMRDSAFNTGFRGYDYREHSGKTLDQVYPFLACFTVTGSGLFWSEIALILDNLDEKYAIWYGDQEAIRQWSENRGMQQTKSLKESAVACLPEYVQKNTLPLCIHFKGAQRKELMPLWADKLFNEK
jgi:hypothetical protein